MRQRYGLLLILLVALPALAQAPAQPAPAEAAPVVEPTPPAEATQPAPPADTTAAQGALDRAELEQFLKGSAEVIGAIQGVQPSQMAAPAPAEGEGLSLNARQCVRMAVERNPRALIAQDEVDAATARIGQARSQLLPQVTGRISGTVTDFNTAERSTGASLLQLGTSAGSLGSILGSRAAAGGGLSPELLGLGVVGLLAQNTMASKAAAAMTPDDHLVRHGLSVTQLLYAGGQVRAAIEASEYLAQSREWQRAATYDGLEFEAKRAFYDALASGALVRVAQESVRTFERNVRDTEQMFEVGMVSHFQKLRAQTELGTRQADAVAAQDIERLALASLRNILSLPQDAAISLEPAIDYLPYLPPMAELVAYANEHRPELVALNHGIEAARQDLRRVQGGYKPRVAASAEYQNTDGGGAAMADGWTLSVGGEWQIAAGGRRKYEKIESKAAISNLEHQRDSLTQAIELEITNAMTQIRDGIAKVQSERDNVDLGREGLRLAELRYQEGVGTQAEILDAELALTTTERNLVQALRNYAVGNASLERATGRSWVRHEGETLVSPESRP